MADEPEPNFEQSLAQLEQIVASLERGEPELTSALSKYEKGVQLLSICHRLLEKAEQSVALLSRGRRRGTAHHRSLRCHRNRGARGKRGAGGRRGKRGHGRHQATDNHRANRRAKEPSETSRIFGRPKRSPVLINSNDPTSLAHARRPKARSHGIRRSRRASRFFLPRANRVSSSGSPTSPTKPDGPASGSSPRTGRAWAIPSSSLARPRSNACPTSKTWQWPWVSTNSA